MPTSPKRFSSRRPSIRGGAALLVLALLGGIASTSSAWAAEDGRRVPPPALDEQARSATSEVAVLAGGCFWGVQGVFQHVKGVVNAVSGYAGGESATAIYETVSTGATGHAESVQITFDPRQITYGQLLQIYFSVAHDPTELNRQGPDTGTQYRSAIFPQDEEQAHIAKAYIAQLEEAHVFAAPVVTSIEPGRHFYPAEEHHQDFLTRHPTYPYIAINDLPKVENLQRLFADRYRADPVLVLAQRTQ
jgi:peptide-methionine (S)-S-oxide reductase